MEDDTISPLARVDGAHEIEKITIVRAKYDIETTRTRYHTHPLYEIEYGHPTIDCGEIFNFVSENKHFQDQMRAAFFHLGIWLFSENIADANSRISKVLDNRDIIVRQLRALTSPMPQDTMGAINQHSLDIRFDDDLDIPEDDPSF